MTTLLALIIQILLFKLCNLTQNYLLFYCFNLNEEPILLYEKIR